MLSAPLVWATLPDEVLLNIFRHLTEYDRLWTSTACKNWRRVYFQYVQPTRLFVKINFDPAAATGPPPEGNNFVKSGGLDMLGRYLPCYGQKAIAVHIECPRPDVNLSRNMGLVVSCLLESMPKLSNLKSFRLSNLRFQNWYMFEPSVCFLVKLCADVLKAQPHLLFLNLSDAYMTQYSANMVLQGLRDSSSVNTLQELDLSYYYVGEFVWDEDNKLLLRSLLCSCKSLVSLKLNYACLRAIQEEALFRALAGSLKQIELHAGLFIDGPFEKGDIIPQASWKAAARHCPNLRVNLQYSGDSLTPVAALLVSGMPLASLSTDVTAPNFSEGELGAATDVLLSHLAKFYKETLELVTLIGVSEDHEVSLPTQKPVVNLVVKCSKIKELTFSSQIMTRELANQIRDGVKKKLKKDRDVIRII